MDLARHPEARSLAEAAASRPVAAEAGVDSNGPEVAPMAGAGVNRRRTASQARPKIRRTGAR